MNCICTNQSSGFDKLWNIWTKSVLWWWHASLSMSELFAETWNIFLRSCIRNKKTLKWKNYVNGMEICTVLPWLAHWRTFTRQNLYLEFLTPPLYSSKSSWSEHLEFPGTNGLCLTRLDRQQCSEWTPTNPYRGGRQTYQALIWNQIDKLQTCNEAKKNCAWYVLQTAWGIGTLRRSFSQCTAEMHAAFARTNKAVGDTF